MIKKAEIVKIIFLWWDILENNEREYSIVTAILG
jgi:hypothetical protein